MMPMRPSPSASAASAAAETISERMPRTAEYAASALFSSASMSGKRRAVSMTPFDVPVPNPSISRDDGMFEDGLRGSACRLPRPSDRHALTSPPGAIENRIF